MTDQADSPRSLKRALRRRMVASILELAPEERHRQERVLIERCPTLPGFAKASSILLYFPAFPEEIDTRPLFDVVRSSGGRAIYPRVDAQEKRLRLFEVVSIAEDLTPGTLGILEPAGHCREIEPGEIDWVLVPGLAFDEHRFRLGRGAGHYDRLLPRVPATSPRWAIALEPQIVATLPSEPHDIAVDGVLTPSQVIE